MLLSFTNIVLYIAYTRCWCYTHKKIISFPAHPFTRVSVSVSTFHISVFGPPSARTSNRDMFHENLKRDVFHDNLQRSSQRMRSESPRHGSQLYGRGRSTSPRASHLYGHPLFRSSHGDLVRASSRHKELPRFASHRDLTRSDPIRSSRRRQTEGSRSKEILATISPRRLPSCHRCLPPGLLASGEPRWNKEFHNPAFHY